jgi:hypothetical protein
VHRVNLVYLRVLTMDSYKMQPTPKPSLSFCKTSNSLFGPRLGQLTLHRGFGDHEVQSAVQIPTPGILVSAPRGVVPHLSCDHVEKSESIRWVNVPVETLYVP